MHSVNRCYAVCPSFTRQPQLERLRKIPGAFISKHVFTQVNDSVFTAIWRQCTKDNIPTLLLLDDAAAEYSTNCGNKGAFARLCYTAPHLNLSIVGVFQKLTACSPALRDNTECLVQFIPTRTDDIDILVREFNPRITDMKKDSARYVRDLLKQVWGEGTFVFIHRVPRHGKVTYHVAFDQEINL